jgi:uncharacterized phage protein (TIGR01671 family)
MRDIKFRDWDIESKFMSSWEEVQEVWEAEGYFSSIFRNDHHIAMQFTGLTDRSGNEIYEGDVIKTTALDNGHGQIGATETVVVRYWMGSPCLCFKDNETGIIIYPFNVNHWLEVIGNIHENPELVK